MPQLLHLYPSFGLMLWVSAFFLLGYALLIGYYLFYWLRVPAFAPVAERPLPFASVVIAARNEAHNLPQLLRALSAQTLSKASFEVIVVDDYSTDNTALTVSPFLSDRVRLIRPEVAPEQSSKKKAIEAGVATAAGPLVVVTDADCLPQPGWLENVVRLYAEKKSAFIVAPVELTTEQFSWVGLFQQLDFMMLQGITAASVQAGAHSMCNGANLAYERSAFYEVAGFAGVDRMASGDDMLLLYKVWRRHPQRVHYLKHKAAIMPTPALAGWRALVQQRIRWSSKATYYQDRRITAVLFFVYGFNLWCLLLLVLAPWVSSLGWYALLCVGAKTIIELLLLVPVSRFFGRQRLLWYFPLLQPIHILYTVMIGILSRKKTYAWKGRRTH